MNGLVLVEGRKWVVWTKYCICNDISWNHWVPYRTGEANEAALQIVFAIRPHNKNAGITNWLFRSRHGGAPDLGAADFGAPNLSLSVGGGGQTGRSVLSPVASSSSPGRRTLCPRSSTSKQAVFTSCSWAEGASWCAASLMGGVEVTQGCCQFAED